MFALSFPFPLLILVHFKKIPYTPCLVNKVLSNNVSQEAELTSHIEKGTGIEDDFRQMMDDILIIHRMKRTKLINYRLIVNSSVDKL